MRAFLIAFFVAATAWAVPTGTVVVTVRVDTNGVLTGSSTNFADANGLVTTQQLAAVDFTAISNLAASALSTGVTAQATADAAMATGAAAIAALSGYAQTTGTSFSGPVSVGTLTNVSKIVGADPSSISIQSDISLLSGKIITSTGSGIKIGKPLDLNDKSITNSGMSGLIFLAVPVQIAPGASFTCSGYVTMDGLPTSAAGSGYVWNSNGFLRIEP